MTTDNDSKVKSLQEENESLKKEIESLKDEFGRIATAFQSHESSCGGHKQHDPEMEKSLESVGAEYDDVKGRYVEAKEDLKALGEELNFLSAQVDNLVQHSYYSFNVKLAGVPEIAHAGCKEPAIETTKLCVRIFEAMGFKILINDIDRAHRVPARNVTNGPKLLICRFLRQVTREEVVSGRREIYRVNPKYAGLGDAADLSNSMLLDHLTPQVQELLVEAKKK